jgi:hypothetical protein
MFADIAIASASVPNECSHDLHFHQKSIAIANLSDYYMKGNGKIGRCSCRRDLRRGIERHDCLRSF